MSSLSWGLLVCTYNREKILPQCLKLGAQQTRPPSEIIVVDASDNWEQTKNKVLQEIAVDYPEINWCYVQAEQKGLTVQRNQALTLAQADVVFLFDDDSFMYPDCAQEVMKLYELDSEEKIQGIQAAVANLPPEDVKVADVKKESGFQTLQDMKSSPFLSKIRASLFKNLFLMSADKLFIPYDEVFPAYTLPETVQVDQDSIYPVLLMQGFRMTYRRLSILEEQFESSLRYYAAGEDLDASYRISRRGLLVEAVNAKVHHFESASGRINRFKVTILSVLNQAVCLRLYSNDNLRLRNKFHTLLFRRVIAELLKDLGSKRLTFPQVRGLLAGIFKLHRVYQTPLSGLRQWYPVFQKELIEEMKAG